MRCGELLDSPHTVASPGLETEHSTQAWLIRSPLARFASCCGLAFVAFALVCLAFAVVAPNEQVQNTCLNYLVAMVLSGAAMAVYGGRARSVLRGVCPYCRSRAEIEATSTAAGCLICRRRFLVRGTRFHQD